ncbi:MAG: phage major capsid protein [Pseudomonas sp.]
MNLNSIREQKSTAVQSARALLGKAESENRSLTTEEAASFDSVKGRITELEAQEGRAAFVAEQERGMAGEPVHGDTRANLESRISLVDAINVQIEGRALSGAIGEFNAEQKRNGVQAQGVLVPQAIFEKRAPQTTTTAAGIVPDDFRADQYVGLLRNAMVVKSLGARVLPNLRGDVVIPRQTGTSTAQWLAEGDSLTDSGMTFDNITLRPRTVGAITELSRQLLQQSNPAIEQLVRDDFVEVVGLAVDKALIHGDNVKEPKGLLTAATGTGTLATLSWATVLAVLETMGLANINPNYWLTHPAVATKLRSTLKSATAGAQYLMEAGQLAGLPVAVTNQLDAKAGSPAKGRIIVGDFREMVIGTWGSLDVLANPYGAAAYARGGVQVRILTTMDMVPRRGNAFAVIDDLAL